MKDLSKYLRIDGESASGALKAPARSSERLVALDALRGATVLAILGVNVYGIALPFTAWTNPLIYGGSDTLDFATWSLTYVVLEQKIFPIFAMLFGAGVVLMSQRVEERGSRFSGLYLRRIGWLALFGVAHSYLLWWGDILLLYAIGGMSLLFLRNLPTSALLAAGALLFLASLGINHATAERYAAIRDQAAEARTLKSSGATLSAELVAAVERWEATRSLLWPTEEDLAVEIDSYRAGYSSIFSQRAAVVTSLFPDLFKYLLWPCLGFMLLGMAMMKARVLTGLRSSRFYVYMTVGGYGVGLPLSIAGARGLWQHEFEPIYAIGAAPGFLGTLPMALGHVGLFMLLVKHGYLGRRFAAAGRMALTNYIMQSVLLTFCFYGYGLGLFGRVDRFPLLGWAIAIALIQLIWSGWWLKRFQYGPLEWAWRSLTYWRVLPLARSEPREALAR